MTTFETWVRKALKYLIEQQCIPDPRQNINSVLGDFMNGAAHPQDDIVDGGECYDITIDFPNRRFKFYPHVGRNNGDHADDDVRKFVVELKKIFQ